MFCSRLLKRQLPRKSSSNHLSTIIDRLSIRSIPFRECPYLIWVSHSRGLPRSTFTISRKASSLWHFQEASTMSKGLGITSAVSCYTAIPYGFSMHGHYRHLSTV